MWRPIHGLGLALCVAGCFSAGNFPNLPEQEQARFLRCQHAMQPVLCGDDKDEVYVTNCVRAAEGSYAGQDTAGTRGRWLVEHGCSGAVAGVGDDS